LLNKTIGAFNEVQTCTWQVSTYYRRDTCLTLTYFDAFLCLYHVMLCARSNDVTACFLVCNNTVLHCQEKKIEIKRQHCKK